ncbi:hypothetical protein RchiOBHm_Chr1g0350851 [Rosa chinensis]|uniref:Uncharacterized protein n=1 Tax=Rosa chinensis TaxID=74649 RepID=A0A2P6SG63_ROSCH|nr:hypothetical protein RchiOBHm_Chr1g0350851 [Rosa chinensis]
MVAMQWWIRTLLHMQRDSSLVEDKVIDLGSITCSQPQCCPAIGGGLNDNDGAARFGLLLGRDFGRRGRWIQLCKFLTFCGGSWKVRVDFDGLETVLKMTLSSLLLTTGCY